MKVIEDASLTEKIYKERHSSGLDILVMPKSGYTKTYAVIAVKYGSVDNRFDTPDKLYYKSIPDGVAHFLEHKLFEGEDENAFEKYAKTGASANAYTSFDKTAYLFSCTENFEKSLEILLDFVQNPYFTDENVAKEQGIIGQEIRMYEDDPGWRGMFNLLGSIYHNNPVKIDIAGTIESISKIDKDVLYRCYNSFYNPQNMVLCVAGDVDPKTVFDIADTHIKDKGMFKTERTYFDEPSDVVKTYVEQELMVSAPQFYLGFKDNDKTFFGIEYLKKETVSEILLEMIAGEISPCYERMYKLGMINQSFSTEYMSGRRFGISMFSGESNDPKGVKIFILDAIRQLKSNPDIKLFERAKKVCYARALRRFNSVERIANDMVSCYFNGISFFDMVKVFEDIKFEHVMIRLDEHFNERTCSLSVIMPHK